MVMKALPWDVAHHTLDCKLESVAKMVSKRSPLACTYTAFWTEMVHEIWKNICKVLYKYISTPIKALANSIIFFNTATKSSDVMKQWLLV